jgi:hypothetical protein
VPGWGPLADMDQWEGAMWHLAAEVASCCAAMCQLGFDSLLMWVAVAVSCGISLVRWSSVVVPCGIY